ncbi:MAG: DUF3137 domain-containing protein [Candidatus Izemoplasmatales bacterium]
MFDQINEKKSRLESKLVFAFVIIGIAFICYIPLGVSIGPSAFFLVGIPFLGGGIYAGYISKQIKKLSNSFKSIYVKEELEKVLPGSQYDALKGFDESEVLGSKLRKKSDRYHSEDLITGTYEDVRFRSADVHQQDVHSNGKTTTVVTVFQGRIYEFDFPKPFYYNLLVLQPMQFRPFEGYDKIKLESIEFNSNLKVYAKDDHEAFYILTPQFMEKLLKLDREYSDKITFSFLDRKLFIAINSRIDYFDIKPFKPVSQELVNSYKEEFEAMISFIKDLKLNEHLFREN